MTNFRKAFRRFLTAATALSLAACATVPATPPAASAARDNSNPALWVVKDHDTTIYLFGTLHVMRPDMQWFNDGVKAAFDRSDTVVTEVGSMNDMQAQARAMMKYAMSPDGKTVTSRLTEAQRATYIAEMTKLGLNWQQFEKMAPMFVGIVATMTKYGKSGAKANTGAEMVLDKAIKDTGKTSVALETAEQQLQWMSQIPMDEQVTGLMDTLTKQTADDMIERMIAAWNAGEAEKLGAIINEAFDNTPKTRALLLTDRNQRWADWIVKRMATPGTVFVAVGAGHLAGRDSVPEYLARQHLKAKRVNY